MAPRSTPPMFARWLPTARSRMPSPSKSPSSATLTPKRKSLLIGPVKPPVREQIFCSRWIVPNCAALGAEPATSSASTPAARARPSDTGPKDRLKGNSGGWGGRGASVTEHEIERVAELDRSAAEHEGLHGGVQPEQG